MDLPGLDRSSVERWMCDNVAGTVAPVEFSLIAGGHSNLTYGASDAAGNRNVVRRGPLGAAGAVSGLQ